MNSELEKILKKIGVEVIRIEASSKEEAMEKTEQALKERLGNIPLFKEDVDDNDEVCTCENCSSGCVPKNLPFEIALAGLRMGKSVKRAEWVDSALVMVDGHIYQRNNTTHDMSKYVPSYLDITTIDWEVA